MKKIKCQFLKRGISSLSLAGLLLLLPIFTACHKEEPIPEDINNSGLTGLYVLNEGVWNMNNSSISYYDFDEQVMYQDMFLRQNGRRLGDTGNDLKQYGSKLYAIISVSEQLEIMDVRTCKSLKQISLVGKSPRFTAFFEDKAYISCNDGSILRLDTGTMTIEASVTAGSNPEGLCVANRKLYVANSGGLNYPNYGNTVSVIDLQTFTEIKTIQVGTNPYLLRADMYGDVYLATRGNYNDIPATFQRIDSQTDEVVQDFNLPVVNFAISGQKAYLYYYNFNTQASWIKVMDISTETIINEAFISDGTVIQIPYAIGVNEENQDVYIADACQFTVNGDLYCFDRDGKKKFSVEVGMNPSALVFIY